MSSLDREIERGAESLLRPLLMPPAIYVVAAALAIAYVARRCWGAMERARGWVNDHPGPLLLVLLASLALAILFGLHWVAQRWRGRAQKADLVADWPALADGLQLPGSSVLSVKRASSGMTVRLQLNRFRGQTPADLVAKLPRLESALRVRPGAVRVLPDASRADLCTLRVIERDPLAKALPWTPPAVTSITEPTLLGLFEDHQPVELRLWEPDRQRHVLIGGVNGSGKSGLINVALSSLARCQDLVIWGVDLKGGMEFSAWAPVLDRLATSPAQAKLLLEAANRALEGRMELLAGRRSRRWRPSRQEPLLLIVIDEISELGPDALALVQRIARMGRAPGVQLVVATQRPSAQQLESTDESGTALRGQLHTRVCMRVTETREADMILGAGLVREGWRADRLLREPGSFLLYDAPAHVKPGPARCFWMSDQAVRAAVADCEELRPTLDERTAAAVEGDRAIADSDVAHYRRHDVQQDPEGMLLTLLREGGAEGLSADDLVPFVPRSRAWVYQRLAVLAERGDVKRLDRGRWAVV